MTALHEVIGHGSGKLSSRLNHGAEPELKEYFSTLEEGRADLMALWKRVGPQIEGSSASPPATRTRLPRPCTIPQPALP